MKAESHMGYCFTPRGHINQKMGDSAENTILAREEGITVVGGCAEELSKQCDLVSPAQRTE